jgi:hypothetical protein
LADFPPFCRFWKNFLTQILTRADAGQNTVGNHDSFGLASLPGRLEQDRRFDFVDASKPQVTAAPLSLLHNNQCGIISRPTNSPTFQMNEGDLGETDQVEMTMAKHANLISANTDLDARTALWHAIREAVDNLAGQCAVYTTPAKEPRGRIDRSKKIPDVPTWKLVEALSLLTILMRADKVHTTEVLNLFGRTGPLHFLEDGQERYLWAQPPLAGVESGLGGIPDLIVSSSGEIPSASTVRYVVECKCRMQLGTQEVRAEFGKAHDLRVESYFIWSFTTPKHRVIEGAKRLGLDLVALGFDTPWRKDFIEKPAILVAHVANALAVSKREKRFAVTLLKSGEDIKSKMLVPQ